MRRNKVALFAHLVWGTWDRLPLLTEEIQPHVYHAISVKCAALGAEVVALGGIEDHVHLLVRLPATLAVADLLKHVKGASSHLVNFAASGGGSFRWQGHYGAFSVSPRQVDRARDYIARQREHHADGNIYDAWEPPLDEKPPRSCEQS